MVAGASIIALCLINKNTNAQLRITGTAGSGTVSVNATTPASTSVMLGGGTGTTGTENTFIGQDAGNKNTTGQKNTFLGRFSGYSNLTGSYNNFVGTNNRKDNTSGYANTFIGDWCGFKNTTGGSNTFLGLGSGIENETAFDNTFVGTESGFSSTGPSNTFIGKSSGLWNTTGWENTFLGKDAGKNNTIGNSNISIGAFSDFSSKNLHHAIAIGYNSIAAGNNVMTLGGVGTSADAVKVGIGIRNPSADLHIYKAPLSGNTGTEILSYWGSTDNQSALTLRTSVMESTKDFFLKMYGITSTSNLLLPFSGTPATAVTSDNMALIATNSSPLMIGINPENPESGIAPSENIHFVNNINTVTGKKAWECMRINKDNGFVGIHTRTAPSGAGTGEPKSLFHVNLTNPAKGVSFNPKTEGIRFEGLAVDNSDNYPYVLVTDLTQGNIMKREISTLTGGGALDRHTNGNTTISPFTEFIGTNNDDDFRIKTNGTPRARFTSSTGLAGTPKYGNFELGTGSSFIGTADKSGAFGENNSIHNAKDVLISGQGNSVLSGSNYSAAIGTNNKIDATTSSLISGNSNELKLSSNGSEIFGEGNIVDASTNVLNSGKQKSITSSHNSIIGGLANITSQ